MNKSFSFLAAISIVAILFLSGCGGGGGTSSGVSEGSVSVAPASDDGAPATTTTISAIKGGTITSANGDQVIIYPNTLVADATVTVASTSSPTQKPVNGLAQLAAEALQLLSDSLGFKAGSKVGFKFHSRGMGNVLIISRNGKSHTSPLASGRSRDDSVSMDADAGLLTLTASVPATIALYDMETVKNSTLFIPGDIDVWKTLKKGDQRMLILHDWNEDEVSVQSQVDYYKSKNIYRDVAVGRYDFNQPFTMVAQALHDSMVSQGVPFAAASVSSLTLDGRGVGGLLARQFAGNDGLHGAWRIDRIITFGTPHAGTPATADDFTSMATNMLTGGTVFAPTDSGVAATNTSSRDIQTLNSLPITYAIAMVAGTKFPNSDPTDPVSVRSSELFGPVLNDALVSKDSATGAALLQNRGMQSLPLNVDHIGLLGQDVAVQTLPLIWAPFGLDASKINTDSPQGTNWWGGVSSFGRYVAYSIGGQGTLFDQVTGAREIASQDNSGGSIAGTASWLSVSYDGNCIALTAEPGNGYVHKNAFLRNRASGTFLMSGTNGIEWATDSDQTVVAPDSMSAAFINGGQVFHYFRGPDAATQISSDGAVTCGMPSLSVDGDVLGWLGILGTDTSIVLHTASTNTTGAASFLPDGTLAVAVTAFKLAFEGDRIVFVDSGNAYVRDLTASTTALISTDPNGQSLTAVGTPCISKRLTDGRYFTAFRAADGTIWVWCSTDGTVRAAYTPTGGDTTFSPVMSDDGQTIVYGVRHASGVVDTYSTPNPYFP